MINTKEHREKHLSTIASCRPIASKPSLSCNWSVSSRIERSECTNLWVIGSNTFNIAERISEFLHHILAHHSPGPRIVLQLGPLHSRVFLLFPRLFPAVFLVRYPRLAFCFMRRSTSLVLENYTTYCFYFSKNNKTFFTYLNWKAHLNILIDKCPIEILNHYHYQLPMETKKLPFQMAHKRILSLSVLAGDFTLWAKRLTFCHHDGLPSFSPNSLADTFPFYSQRVRYM